MIHVSGMFAAERKRLARRPAANEINIAGIRAKLNLTHIALHWFRPICDRGVPANPVLSDGVATPPVPFDYKIGLESGCGQAEPESASTRK
jgi:hypothetical protein